MQYNYIKKFIFFVFNVKQGGELFYMGVSHSIENNIEGVKMKKNNKICFNENRLNDNFENINSWINNCDNKASIMLGFIGIIVTILLTNNEFISTFIKLINEVIEKKEFVDELYIVLIFIFISLTLYGIFNIFKVIYPSLKSSNTDSKSLLYYDSISKMDLSDYKNAIFQCEEKDYLVDLITQIHTNSRICSKKFLNLKKGLSLTIYGLIGFLIIFVMGIIAYL